MKFSCLLRLSRYGEYFNSNFTKKNLQVSTRLILPNNFSRKSTQIFSENPRQYSLVKPLHIIYNMVDIVFVRITYGYLLEAPIKLFVPRNPRPNICYNM